MNERSHISLCPQCGTRGWTYIDTEKDLARVHCPAGHPLPPAHPAIGDGEATAGKSSDWPGGEPGTVRAVEMGCPTWCNGDHAAAPGRVNHRAEIGTTTVHGGVLTVALLFGESTTGGQHVGPGVTVRWPNPDGDGTGESAQGGVDLAPAEALALGQLLITAYARLAQAIVWPHL